MERLWPWLLLVAATEISRGLAGGSIGLAEPAIEAETASSAQQTYSPGLSRDEILSVRGSHLAFTGGDTETALNWDDDVTNTSASFPCTACTTAAEETDPVQVETEGSLKALPPTPVELTVKEAFPVEAVAAPLRGLRSFVLGSLVLGFLLFIISAPDEVYDEDGTLDAWRHFFAEEVIDGMFALDDFSDSKVPAFPFKILTFWMVAGAAPMLFLSGLVSTIRSLKRRRQGILLPEGPRFAGLPVSIMTALLSMWIVIMPVYRIIDDYEDHILEEVSMNIAWGINVAYLSLVLL